MPTEQDDAANQLQYYDNKCRQHLSRVWLAHSLAAAGLQSEANNPQTTTQELFRISFDDAKPELREVKFLRGLHKIHLITLKAEFELYLNRVLTVIWSAHFASLAAKTPGKRDVLLRDLAVAALHESVSRDLVIEMVVPTQGLSAFVAALKDATDIQLPKGLFGYDYSLWSQIPVAFEVRHLIEHRDGKIDPAISSKSSDLWSHSSWGLRSGLPSVNQRVTVELEDVERTCMAMRATCELLTVTLVQWHSRQLAETLDGDPEG